VQPLPQNKKAENKNIGNLGESVAARYLESKGLAIVDRNYLKKWGEIDIVARETSGKVHFAEVKAVSYETRQALEYAVTHETWRPEEKVDQWKLKKIAMAIESWVAEHTYDGDWQIDVVVVRLVPREKYATVKWIDNVIT
jgi:putative endonuclease